MPKKNYPRLRTGDGYSPEGKEEFDNAVAITLTYGDVYAGIDKANIIATNYFKEVSKNFYGSLKNPNMKRVISPSTKSPGTFKAAVLFPSGFKNEIDSDMRAIGSVLADEMKKEIKNVIKTAPGARGAGRIETRLMLDSVKGRRTNYSKAKGSLTVTSGWLDTWQKYFGFQEEGTRNGIKPMRAIQHTAMLSFPEAFKIAKMYTARFGPRAGFKGFK